MVLITVPLGIILFFIIKWYDARAEKNKTRHDSISATISFYNSESEDEEKQYTNDMDSDDYVPIHKRHYQ